MKTADIRARLAKNLGRKVVAPTAPTQPSADLDDDLLDEAPLNAAPVATEEPKVPYADVAWDAVSKALKRAAESGTQADANIAVELLKNHEYHNGLPSILFGKQADGFRDLYAQMIQHEQDTGEPDLDVYPEKLIEEYKRLFDTQYDDLPPTDITVARKECDNFRGRTVTPVIGDILQGAYPAYDPERDTMLKTSEESKYVVESVALLPNRTDVAIRRIRLQNDASFYNPRNRILIITIGNGKNRAVNGVNVVAQLMRVFTTLPSVEVLEKLEQTKED